MVSLGDGITQQLGSSPASPSVTPVPGLLSVSLTRPLSMTVANIIPFFKSAPSTHMIRGLRWCKNARTRTRHEFLLLEVERPGICNVWLRIERRPDKDASLRDLFFSDAKLDDSVEMCDDPTHLWNESWSEILVVTHFKDPPHLEVLGHLLSVMETESCKYKVYPENCYFFCSVIYEILFSMSGGENVKGTPSHLSLSLAPRVRASIKEKMDELRLVPLVHRVSRQQTLETESMIKPPTPPENSEKTQEDTSIGDKPNASTPQEAQMGYQDVSLGIDLVLSLPPSPSGVAEFSVPNMLTQPWDIPVSLSISTLIPDLMSSRTGHITLLNLYKDLGGSLHQFLLLRLEFPEHRTSWLRLDRRSDRDTTAVQLITLPSSPVDTATLCSKLDRLTSDSQSRVQATLTFRRLLSLDQLGILLSVILQESPQYTIFAENCYFFCSVIYERLSAMGEGLSVGVPPSFNKLLTPGPRARIRQRTNPTETPGHEPLDTLRSPEVMPSTPIPLIRQYTHASASSVGWFRWFRRQLRKFLCLDGV